MTLEKAARILKEKAFRNPPWNPLPRGKNPFPSEQSLDVFCKNYDCKIRLQFTRMLGQEKLFWNLSCSVQPGPDQTFLSYLPGSLVNELLELFFDSSKEISEIPSKLHPNKVRIFLQEIK